MNQRLLLCLVLIAACGDDGSAVVGDAPMTDSPTVDAPSDASIDAPPAPLALNRLSIGETHSCYLDAQGAAFCWGADDVTQLGNGPTKQSMPTATAVVGLPGPGVEIAAGGGSMLDGHVHVRQVDGTVSGWGGNGEGQLGDGTRLSPATVTTAINMLTATQIATGSENSCAIEATHAACWGTNEFGQLAASSIILGALSPFGIALPAAPAKVAVGSQHACALLTDSRVMCWGRNQFEQVGAVASAGEAQRTPIQVTGLPSSVTAIALGRNHGCAIDDAGAVKCWGANGAGQLGDTTVVQNHAAVSVSGLAGPVTAVCGGSSHSCALLATGEVQCWGGNLHGQLGDGTLVEHHTAVMVTNLTGVAELACGGDHTCARLAAGGVRCWGANSEGQLGDNSQVDRTSPVAVQGL